jgi:hypothetical protein
VRHSKVARPCPSWVTSDKTHIEHNESVVALIADMRTDMDFRHSGPDSEVAYFSQPNAVCSDRA